MRRRWTILLPEPPDSRFYDALVIVVGVLFIAYTLWALFG
jgi:hypothetical protein